MKDTKPDVHSLPKDLVMHVSSDAYVRVLWAFAIALAKLRPAPAGLADELVRQLDNLPSMGDSPDNGGRVWQALIESHANELLDALGYQGEVQAG